MSRAEKTIILLVLSLSALLLYSNSFNNPFIFDDEHMIEGNLLIKDLRHIPLFFKGYVTSYPIAQGMCRPLLMITFSLNYLIGKLNPQGYHLINIIFHSFKISFIVSQASRL